MDNIMKLNLMSHEENIKKRKILIEDVVTKDNEKAEPCLVQFSNGIIKNNENISGKLYKNASEKYIRRKKDRMLKVSTPHLSYVGKNFGADISDLKERLFLGVLDEKRNKMQLVEMSYFLLHPEITDTSTLFPPELSDSSHGYETRKRLLEEHFGGKKGRLISRKRAQTEYAIENMSVALHDALDTIEPKNIEDEEVKRMDSYDQILPRCNRNAFVVEQVYSLASIISDEHLTTFNAEAMECLDGNMDQSAYSPLFNHTVANVKLSAQTEEFQAKMVCVALFTEKLIALLPSCPKKMKSIINLCPKVVKTKIFTTFTEGKRITTKTQEDKLISHVMVLSLLSNNYEVPFHTLNQSLGSRKDRLESLARVVGASYTKAGNIVLKLPLAKIFTGKLRKIKRR